MTCPHSDNFCENPKCRDTGCIIVYVNRNEKKFTQEEMDLFAISFCVWYSHAEDAQIYRQQNLSAYKLLELYKNRPFLRTDAPKSN